MAEIRLDAFCADHLRNPWKPGHVDCLLALADWMIWRGHEDAAAHLRGIYDSEDGFRAIIEEAGGVVPLVGSCAARIGLRRLETPVPGCIGVIGSRSDFHRQFGAIFDGSAWRVRFVDAYPALKACPLAIWNI